SLIYKTLILSGLRKGELASLTVAQLQLQGDSPFTELDAPSEKNRRGSVIPLRTDLAADLREWLAAEAERLPEEARRRTRARQAGLPPATPVFDVPKGLLRIRARDLGAAGIARWVEVNDGMGEAGHVPAGPDRIIGSAGIDTDHPHHRLP